jgi:GntR family transcriptional regulator
MENLTGFYDDAVSQGQKVNTQVLELDVIPADEEISSFLEISINTPIIKLRRLRFINGEPVVVVNTYIPERLCPGLVKEDFSNQSLYHVLLEKYGLEAAQGIRTIESVNAFPQIAKLLGVSEGAALTLLKSTSRLADGTPLEYYISWHRGDRSRFTVHLVNPKRSEILLDKE